MKDFDFSGWATKNNLKCSDGRVIMKDAFAHDDGQTVPLVWNHEHNNPLNVLGHALLENCEEGVYAYCQLNDSEAGKAAKLLVEHGDVKALSIYANQLKQQGSNVIHGAIKEVSLVLAGANPGAFINSIVRHSDSSEADEEAVIYTGEELYLSHANTATAEPDTKEDTKDEPEETVGDVFNTLSEKQKNVVYAIIANVTESTSAEATDTTPVVEETEESKGGTTVMKHNVFEGSQQTDTAPNDTLRHSETEAAIFSDAKRYGSLKDSAIAHGITNIDYLYPDAKTTSNVPNFITRKLNWVTDVMNGVHHTPFARIKSTHATLTEADARAKGYIKGKLKAEEVFSLLKRTTTPTTIYKKQKLDRDDVIDITDFDVVTWVKSEMRLMLDEEIARAILVGDGRLSSSDDKINEQNIRPIWTDEDLYTIKETITIATADNTADKRSKAFIQHCIKSRKNYKGSGSPILFTTEDVLTDCLLMEDTTGRVIYETVDKLATALRVSRIVTVPVMESLTRVVSDVTHTLMGIIVNLDDYNIGADKGGAINMFDDFDIDYNAQKYLIETRCSGALTVPYSAIALELVVTA